MGAPFEDKLKKFTHMENNMGKSPFWGHFISEYLAEFFFPNNVPVIMTVIGDTPVSSEINSIYNDSIKWIAKKVPEPDTSGYKGPWPPPVCPMGVIWKSTGIPFYIFQDCTKYNIIDIQISSSISPAVYFKLNSGKTVEDTASGYKILTLDQNSEVMMPVNATVHIYIKIEEKPIP